MAGTRKMKNFFSHRIKNLLFLPCNVAALQNLYTWVERGNVRVKCLAQERNVLHQGSKLDHSIQRQVVLVNGIGN